MTRHVAAIVLSVAAGVGVAAEVTQQRAPDGVTLNEDARFVETLQAAYI